MLPVYVVCNVQVCERIAVKISGRATGGPVFANHPRHGRRLSESSVTISLIQPIEPDIAKIQIIEAIVIKVSHRHTLAETSIAKSRQNRGIRE